MAEAIVGPLVGKLQELAVSETKALVAVNDDIRSLRDRLMWMQAFLRHADPRRRDTSNELIRVWIKQTRDAAFDAEDAIDHYHLNVDLSRYPGWTRSIIRFLAGFTTQISIRHDLSRKIAEINSRLEDIINNKEKYKIDDAANNSAIVQWKPSTVICSSTTNLDDVYAPVVKRKNLEELEKAYQGTQKGQVVVLVIGESGVGKTTLVRELYEKSSTKAHFHERIWASFPPHLSPSNILQIIYQQLQGKETWSKKDVEKNMQDKLKNINFMLVIDGEISNTDLNAILAALPDGNQDSKGVVIHIVHGNHSSGNTSKHHIKLSNFDKPTTIDLFMKMVHKGEKVEDQILTTEIPWNNTETDDDIILQNKLTKETGEKIDLAGIIYYITGGLPLSIALLSGLVKTKEYPNEWKAVFKHIMSKQSKRLDSILTMCFDDLPHDLKSCFLYFAALPVNTPIETRKLVRLWMAEGFLMQKDGKTMEKVGRIYLKELIARNLVKLVNSDDTNGDDKFVTVHHKVHEFLQVEAQEANFVDIHSGDNNHSLTTARRLSLQNYTDKFAALKNSLPKLRSILSNFQKEEESDSDDSDDDEYDDEDYEDDEDEDDEDDHMEEEKLEKDGDQEDEVEENNVSGGNSEEAEQKNEDEEADETREDELDRDNELNGNNEENKKNEERGSIESLEQDKDSVNPGTMSWYGLSRCWGNRINSQDYNKSNIRRMFQYSKFLRVINLQGIDFGKKLPATIKNVAHLQYLGVTACSLEYIPSAIGKLKNLQTLDVRDTSVRQLPIEFWKIRTLRHVFGNCLTLPKRVGDLKNLQTLETIQPDEKNGWDSKTFERMNNLRTLKIWDFSENSANAKALSAIIEGSNVLQYLETMELYFENKNIPLRVFTSNSQRRLCTLMLDGKLDMIPKDFKFCAPNLTVLSLENTRVSQDFIDKLGKLPLIKLILDTESYKDNKDQLVFHAGLFKSLTKLKLSDLDLKKLKINKSALPKLKDLDIVWYLEELKIVVYGERGFVKKIQDEDEDLFQCITQIPVASKKSGEVLASNNM